MVQVLVPCMVEVICEDCHEVQTTHIFATPECDACGSPSLTATTGYTSPDTFTASQ